MSDLGSEYLQSEQDQYMGLGQLRTATTPTDVNRQLLYKAALKSILFDNKPTKEEFGKMVSSSLDQLSLIAEWMRDQPDLHIDENILAILDPKKVAKNKSCLTKRGRGKGGTPGLPAANCVKVGQRAKSNVTGMTYVSDGKKWIKLLTRDGKPLEASF